MTAKAIKYGEKARRKMMRGLDILTDAVKMTLGSKGRHMLINKTWGSPKITKDGYRGPDQGVTFCPSKCRFRGWPSHDHGSDDCRQAKKGNILGARHAIGGLVIDWKPPL